MVAEPKRGFLPVSTFLFILLRNLLGHWNFLELGKLGETFFIACWICGRCTTLKRDVEHHSDLDRLQFNVGIGCNWIWLVYNSGIGTHTTFAFSGV